MLKWGRRQSHKANEGRNHCQINIQCRGRTDEPTTAGPFHNTRRMVRGLQPPLALCELCLYSPSNKLHHSAKGTHKRFTIKSATAKFTINKLVRVRRPLLLSTATITTRFPQHPIIKAKPYDNLQVVGNLQDYFLVQPPIRRVHKSNTHTLAHTRKREVKK